MVITENVRAPAPRPASGKPVRPLRLPRKADRGSVTAETAVVLPVLVIVLGMVLWGVGAAGAQLRCIDAARAGARAYARGEDPAAARLAVDQAAPRGATLVVRRSGELVEVRVRAPVHPPGALQRMLPTLEVSAVAVAAVEPGADSAPFLAPAAGPQTAPAAVPDSALGLGG
jgi:hypothetical protein